MRQTRTILSTYAADTSGVCSALYELGGMTVMHDASGCNSTYNTHDEPRWYDMDSMVFISALTEMEAILGEDEKLVTDMVEAVRALHPAFAAVAGTPIPMLTGCDLKAVAHRVEQETGVPAFGFDTNGMRSYVMGAGEALAAYAERFVRTDVKKQPGVINLLGVTPLDFSVTGTVESMKSAAKEAGFRVRGTWAMGSTPEDLALAGEAEGNLVVSSVGLPLARALQKKCGTPYVVGTPCAGPFLEALFGTLRKTTADGICRSVFADYDPGEKAEILLIGESVTARSLAMAIFRKYGTHVQVLCPMETEPGILSGHDLHLTEEPEIIGALAGKRLVIADPMYKPVIPSDAVFYPLPHEACSGRIWRKEIPNVIENL